MEVRRVGLLIGSEILILAAIGLLVGTLHPGFGQVGVRLLPIAIVVLLLAGILGSLGWLVAEEGVEEVREDPTPVAALLLLVGLLTATVMAGVLLVGQSLTGAAAGLVAAGALAAAVLREGLETTVDRPVYVVALFLSVIVALLAVGSAFGTVGFGGARFGFGGARLSGDPGSVLVASLIVGVIVGVAYVLFQRREAVQERAERVARNPKPVAGGAIVAVLSALLFFIGLVLGGYGPVGLGLGVAAVAALVSLVALTGPDLPVRHPVLLVGAFAGLVLVLFGIGTGLGRAGINFGDLDVDAGPIIVVVVLLGIVVAVAWFALRMLTREKDEEAREAS